MGHRALVAYREADGTFTLRYAHWGEDLAAHLSPATPFGGFADPDDAAPEPPAVADRLGLDRRGGYRPPVRTRVDPRPLATGQSAGAVLDALDAGFESLVVVPPSRDARTYLVCSLALDGNAAVTNGEEADGEQGADLVLARPDGDPESLRSWFVEAKSDLSAAVAAGAVAPGSARTALRRALAARATVRPGDDASFLRDR